MLPAVRDTLGVIFFGLLSLVGTVGWVREGNPWPMLAALGLMAAGSWLAYRGRLLGAPTLIAQPERISFRRGRHEVSADWDDIERVTFGPYLRKEIWLVRRNGPPISFSDSMTTADGERFDMVFEDYWTPPKERR